MSKKKDTNKNNIGFLPCFSKYRFDRYPCNEVYNSPSIVNKVKQLLAAFVDSDNPQRQLRQNYGIGKGGIQAIRPDDSKEARDLIKFFAFQYQIFRIDYGDSEFKVIFGLGKESGKRLVYILAFDVHHDTFR
jgi:hypothetical protein